MRAVQRTDRLYVLFVPSISLILSALWRVWHFPVTALSFAHAPLRSYPFRSTRFVATLFFVTSPTRAQVHTRTYTRQRKKISREAKRCAMWLRRFQPRSCRESDDKIFRHSVKLVYQEAFRVTLRITDQEMTASPPTSKRKFPGYARNASIPFLA